MSTTIYSPRETITSTQHEILVCTVETLAELGYAQTTIGEISKRLGVSKGVIHYHFASKEGLIQETIAFIYTVAREYMSSQIWDTTNEWEQIRHFIEVSGMFYQRASVYIKALQSIRTDFKPIKHKSLAQTLYEKELSDLTTILVSGQKKGIFRKFDPAITALTLRLALNGMATCLYAQPGYDAKMHASELVELFRRGLCKEK